MDIKFGWMMKLNFAEASKGIILESSSSFPADAYAGKPVSHMSESCISAQCQDVPHHGYLESREGGPDSNFNNPAFLNFDQYTDPRPTSLAAPVTTKTGQLFPSVHVAGAGGNTLFPVHASSTAGPSYPAPVPVDPLFPAPVSVDPLFPAPVPVDPLFPVPGSPAMDPLFPGPVPVAGPLFPVPGSRAVYPLIPVPVPVDSLLSAVSDPVNPSRRGPPRRPRPRHVPHRDKPPAVVERRNARERRRIQGVKQAFLELRRHLPPLPGKPRRQSRMKTLRDAVRYISHLLELVAAPVPANTDYGQGSSPGGRWPEQDSSTPRSSERRLFTDCKLQEWRQQTHEWDVVKQANAADVPSRLEPITWYPASDQDNTIRTSTDPLQTQCRFATQNTPSHLLLCQQDAGLG